LRQSFRIAIVSPDYSDVDTQEGPSPGDFGSYTKFNYSRVHSNFRWRLPFPDGTTNRANFNPNLLSNPLDNRASIVYGEKEVWQLHSVESKTHIAQFYYSNREDALGVIDLDLGKDTSKKMVKLDSIVLYARADFMNNPDKAVPIKKVSFSYSYLLCPNIPNSTTSSGKLTLTKIYITYGRSEKGGFSPYEFSYDGSSILNIPNGLDYNYQGYNRWGTFQRSLKTTGSCDAQTSALGNDDYPYVVQDSALQAKYAAAWNLTKIKLPSGGLIEVTYESHDYAYVQNKPAMEMLQIEGLGRDTDFPGNVPDLFLSGPVKTQNDYLYFKLRTPISSGTVAQKKNIVGRDYLKEIFGSKNLYFKCLVDLKSTCNGSCPHYEYVFGYAEIDDWGVCTNSPNYGFIKLKQVCLSDRDINSNCVKVNPIAKAGWQFTRIHYPDLIHRSNLMQNSTPINPEAPANATSFVKTLVEPFADMLRGVQTSLLGPNRFCLDNNYSQKLVPLKSWIRLYSPEGKKLAGGSRVKRITITDNWTAMSTVNDKGTYGQEFSYRTELGPFRNFGDGMTKRWISSGVASYEPMIGGDENPFRQPETYNETLKLAPDNRYYQELPYGESFLPSPQIIYSRVAVTTLRYDNNGLLATPQCVSTGQTISEYYTAKDYPTRISKTNIQVLPAKSSPIAAFLKLDYKEYMNASQGFCIELNDMHGKPKAQWNYDDKGQRISGMEYLYKTKKKDTDPTAAIKLEPVVDSLDNTATVINRDGIIQKKQIGIDFQVTADSRESKQETRTRGVAINSENFLVGVFPMAAIIPWPIWENEKVRFRSMSISKVINRYALLEKVVAYDASSRIETENIAYDAETGEVLVTRTFNEFGDPIYNVKYPAHFAYPGMRQAYENWGVQLSSVSIVSNPPVNVGTRLQLNPTTAKFFQAGDELMVSRANGTSPMRAWVLNANNVVGNYSIDLIDAQGASLTTYLTSDLLNIKVIRSGKRNQQSFEIGSVTVHKVNPVEGVNSLFINPSNVIDASVTEYADYWVNSRFACTTIASRGEKGTIEEAERIPVGRTNHYRYGHRGVWRPLKSWVNLTDRKPVTPLANLQTDIRNDGKYQSFQSFWVLPTQSETPWSKNTSGWTWTSEATKYNNYGFQIEARDPLNRYSAELPGYGNTQAIAVAANARYREIHFDGFEENGLSFLRVCPNDSTKHFPHLFGGSISKTFSHTGSYSLKVTPGGTAQNGNPSVFVFDPVTLPTSDQPGTAPTSETNIADSNYDVPQFGMAKDSVYLISAWVRTSDLYAENKTSYDNKTRIEFEVYSNSTGLYTTTSLVPSGNVIDGWQRISQIVTVPSNASSFRFKFINTNTVASALDAYFDDFRVQPFRSSMKTYVYDVRSNRLVAALDDENYATIYEYNNEGMLERVKRETEKGIITVQETRTGIKKQ
jgi:hypothetical protein